MISKLAASLKSRFYYEARNRRKIYASFVNSKDGQAILSDLMRGSGILDVDEKTSMEDSIRIISRWWPVANILNGAQMTDEQVMAWATRAAAERAHEIDTANQQRMAAMEELER